jgi:hypothetical protein
MAQTTDQTLGLLVPGLGATTTIEVEQIAPLAEAATPEDRARSGIIEGSYANIPILTIPTLLTVLVQQIGMAIANG